jgi:hypothetical protein
MVRGIREFQEDFRDDRRRQEENQDFRREEQRRQEMERRQEESERQRREDERRRIDAIATVVNDETITIEAADRKIINDPEIMMMPTGEIVRRTRTKRGLGSGAFAQQFSVLGGQLPKVKKQVRKKARKELDRLQAEAFREANRLLRTKAGKLRKGITQSDVAKRAQKILKRLRK